MSRPKVDHHPVACTPSAVGVTGKTEFAHLRCNGSGKSEVKDDTECSSSFNDSDSGIENPGSDSEVTSYVDRNTTSDLAMGFGDFLRMRRKKLTLQWRTYIQPFMWRCKWLELQIKNCNAQASKYERELASYNTKKLFPTDNFNHEGFCVKSLPFPNDLPRDKIMRRKKRRKIEDMEDITPYMSNHNLFSYEGKQTRAAANGARMDDDSGIQEKSNGDDELEVSDRLWLQSWNGNVQLEIMLRELDSLQSKVKNLRSRMFKVKSQNAEIFSLADELDSLVASSANELSSPVQSLASPSTSGVIIPEQSPNIEPELPSQNDNGSGGVVGVSGDHQSNQQAKCMKVKEEDDDMEEAKMQPIGYPQGAKSSSHEALSNVLEDPDHRDKDDDHSVAKTRSIAKLTTAPKGRKKRGKRRGSSSRWSRRSYG